MCLSVDNMTHRSECNLADMKLLTASINIGWGGGIIMWCFRAQLALTDPLSCNSLQCPSSHPMLHRHGYVCKLLEFRCVCRVCIYSHTHMQACLFSDWFLWGKPSSQIQLVSLIGSIIVFQMIPSMHVIRTYGNACRCFEPLVRLRCVCVCAGFQLLAHTDAGLHCSHTSSNSRKK